MNVNRRPTLEDLSLFMDDLVHESDRDWIRDWIAKDEGVARDYQLLSTLQGVSDADAPEPEQKFFTDIRAAILDEVKKEQSPARQAVPWLIRFLSPKRLVPVAVGVCSLLLAATVLMDPGQDVGGNAKLDNGTQVAVVDTDPLESGTGTVQPVELTPDQKEQVETAMRFFTSAATQVSEKTSDLQGATSAQLADRFSGVREYIAANGKSLLDTGTDRVGDWVETAYKRGVAVSEPLTDASIKNARYQAGSALLGLALGVV